MDSDQWGSRGKGQAAATVQEHSWEQLRAVWGRELQVLCSRGEQLPPSAVYGEVWAWLARPDLRICIHMAGSPGCGCGF